MALDLELLLYLFDGELWHFVGGRDLVGQLHVRLGLLLHRRVIDVT